jgi:N-acetylglutamate synthase-like GNAT family acetyltransferase
MPASAFKIRRALVQEAGALSDLASRSKSHWPYDEEYLQLCRSVTHVTEEDIQAWPFSVISREGLLCGFSAVCELQGERMLDHLWIDPPYMGKGLGRMLFEESVARAIGLGWASFTIASDPYAEGFYKKIGAKRIGERESKIKAGFFLPLLEFRFA